MAKRDAAAIKAAFKQENDQGGDRPRGPSNYYPFFAMEIGQRAVIRFLPDTNEANPRGFLVEKVFHNLMINGQKKTVPCLSMYNEDCPVCKVSSQYYKTEGKGSPNGKKYWRKKQYLAQALIIEDPLPNDKDTNENHEGKVRVVALGWQIYGIIKDAMGNDDPDDRLEELPDDFEGGYDFVIKKTQQGEYATYTMGTKFLSKQRPLSEVELELAQDGSIELSTLLPPNPGLEKVQAMLNADLNGGAFEDSEGEEGTTEATPAAKPVAAKADKPAPRAVTKVVEADSEEEDVEAVLAQIRARRTAAKAAA